ncbi:MAG: UDP-N-acetylmuramoyl-L-alanine--D-glutamate ligase, partial [Delftia sp.]|nr:UDP-N-acetylmuramoyl-L-alanine--D-glutamate ligase [Delftia sp.]
MNTEDFKTDLHALPATEPAVPASPAELVELADPAGMPGLAPEGQVVADPVLDDSPAPAPAGDGEAELPAAEVSQLPQVPVALTEPVPDIATLTAAKDAAAFVAQIFADPSISDSSDAEVTPLAAEEAVESEQVLPPVAAGWPGEQVQHLQGQRVLVLGLGASGLAMARWCVRCGAEVIVADTRQAPPQLQQLSNELPQVRFVPGEFTAQLVDGQSLGLVYRSPGLSPAAVAPVVDAARAQGLPVGGELDLFAMALKALSAAHGYRPTVLGI